MTDLVLRPRSATELIDAAFQVYRRAPVPFMVAMALVYVPWLALRLIFSLNVPETPDQFTPGIMRVLLITAAAGIIIYGLAGGAVSILAKAVYLDEPIDVAQALRHTLGRMLPLIVSTIVAFALIGVGFMFLIVPGIFLATYFFAVRQAVVLEDKGAFDALGRSGRLSRGNKWHILGTLILVVVLSTIVNLGAVMLINLQPSKVITSVLATAVTIVVYPILGITETVLYFDTRIRNEGFDVEYLAGAVTDTSPTAGPVA
ncbi:MAG TPA: hypothetical protein VGQ44_14865 [Gemmatimonadaceae bacterium]|jgi:hypothetical protein|nr:hypothetical protein [Gemmatimonadaceae bacterium]